MTILFRRLCAALLTVAMLLPCLAHAAEKEAYAYTLRFDMQAGAYPEADRPLLTGIADLLNTLEFSGVYATDGTGFDNNVTLTLAQNERTGTELHIFGTDSNWWFRSPLLGAQCVRLNNSLLLEFAMKAYAHLSMPLQYAALLVCPYTTTSAFEWILPKWQETFAGNGTRTVSRQDVMALAEFISENGESDRTFYYWVHALTRDIGIDADVLDGLYFLPEWVDTFLAEDGLTITIDSASERWTTGSVTLFERTTGKDSCTWQLTLPENDYGQTLTCTYNAASSSTELVLLITEASTGDVFSAAVRTAGFPEGLPFTGTADVAITAGGRILPSDINLQFSAESDGNAFTLMQKDAITGVPMLTVSGTIAPAVAPTSLTYEAGKPQGDISILTVNEAALSGFMGNILIPLVKGAWPLLVHMPASSIASMYNLLEQYGVLDMLLFSLE